MKSSLLILIGICSFGTLYAQPDPIRQDKGDYHLYESEQVVEFRTSNPAPPYKSPTVYAPIDDEPPVDTDANLVQYFAGKTQKVYLDMNPSINIMVQKHKEIVNRTRSMPGYRVQVFVGIEREAANRAKGDFVSKFPGTECYLMFIEPSYRIRVGNFTTRLRAENFCKRVRGTTGFEGAFVVREEAIVVPKLKPLKTGGEEE